MRPGEIVYIEEIVANDKYHADASVRVFGTLTFLDVAASKAVIKHKGKSLGVDTSLLGQIEFRIGGLFQFIGEMGKQHGKLQLRARVVRNIDGLDAGLFERALQVRREFLNEEESDTALTGK
jgi:hypothetical protein